MQDAAYRRAMSETKRLKDAIDEDVLAGRLPELNPGDRARLLAEREDAQRQAQQRAEDDLRAQIDAAIKRLADEVGHG